MVLRARIRNLAYVDKEVKVKIGYSKSIKLSYSLVPPSNGVLTSKFEEDTWKMVFTRATASNEQD